MLEIELYLYCSEVMYNTLKPYINELNFSFMVAKVFLFNINSTPSYFYSVITDVFIYTKITTNRKCIRCWQRVVGHYTHGDGICNRCVMNLETNNIGEKRIFF